MASSVTTSLAIWSNNMDSSIIRSSLASKLNPNTLFFSVHSQIGKGSVRSGRNLRIPLCVRESRAAVVTTDSWEKSILKSDTPVLVEFYASWCGPCSMVRQVINEISDEYAGRLKCYILNADENSPVAEDYEIKAVPVVLLFKNGKKCESIFGTMPKEFYMAAIDRVLGS